MVDIAVRILMGLNKVIPTPERPCARVPDPDDLIIPTNPATIEYFEIQRERCDYKWSSEYRAHVDFKGKVILDLGCGFGGGTYAYSTKGAKRAVGIELEEAYVRAGAKYLADTYGVCDNLEYIAADATSIPMESNSVDIIIANDFMEHVSDPAMAIREAHRLLRDGGYFFFEFPSYFSPNCHHMNYQLYTPWLHLMFSDNTIVAAARKVAVRENHYYVLHFDWERRFRSNLNKLSITRCHRILRGLNDCELVDLYYRSEYKLLQPLVYIRGLDECLSYAQFVLRKTKNARVRKADIVAQKVRWLKKDWTRLMRRLGRR